MSKRVKAGELDESLIIQSFKNTGLLSNPADAIVEKKGLDSQAGGTEGEDIPAKEEKTEESGMVPDNTDSKSKSRRRKGNYDEVYLKKKELKTRQPVYISQEVHQDITRLVHLLALMDKGISVGGYIDNVLAEHLKQHKEEIADLYRQQLDDFIQPKKK